VSPRGTIHYMSPIIYGLYILKLKHNLGPAQLLEAWQDPEKLKLQFYYYDTPQGIVRELLEKALSKFWSLQATRPLTRTEAVLVFAKTYSLSWKIRWFYKVK
jgi:hypothetical protein